MTRATETADLILNELDMDSEIKVEKCDLIREGAPIMPEPPVTSWMPERHVLYTLFYYCVKFLDVSGKV